VAPASIPKSRWVYAGAGLVLYLCLYFGIGLRPAPRAHSLATPLDALIPFWPGAIWVYATVYPAVLGPVFIVQSPARFRRIALGLMAVIVICAAAFALWPVETESIRRSAAWVSGPDREPSFTVWGFGLLFALDPPRNAFPSLHVALAAVVALGLGRSLPLGGASTWRLPGLRQTRPAPSDAPVHSSGTAWPARLWLAAVVASVVLVRQHYVVDAVAGLALGALVYRVGVGGDGEPAAPGAFERRGAIGLALVVLAFYAVVFAVYLAGWDPGS